MRFLCSKRVPEPKTASFDELLVFLDNREVHHSVVAFCNNEAMDTDTRTSSGVNPHNTRYIVAAEFRDVAVVDDSVKSVQCWFIVETRYFFVDFFRKVISHVLRKLRSLQTLPKVAGKNGLP